MAPLRPRVRSIQGAGRKVQIPHFGLPPVFHPSRMDAEHIVAPPDVGHIPYPAVYGPQHMEQLAERYRSPCSAAELFQHPARSRSGGIVARNHKDILAYQY